LHTLYYICLKSNCWVKADRFIYFYIHYGC